MTEPAPEERDARVGLEVGSYSIVRLLGKGGMGAVYEARHVRLGRRVAIKFLLPELVAKPEILRRFDNEAIAAGGLEHPNLVAVLDLGRAADGAPYLVMEFLPGEDCARLLRRLGLLPVTRAVNIALQSCRGVAVAHDAGIVHRDLKPENLFLTDTGDGSDQIKVLDFGIAKLRPAEGQAATRTGSTFGTTHYMSPEQARGAGEVDQRTDVWSLGVVLYELLAGRKPFDAEQPLNVVHQILNATPAAIETVRPGLPRGLAAAIERAMRKDAGERFPTVRAFASALAPFAGRASSIDPELATAATRTSEPTGAPTTAPRRPAGRARGTILALGGVVVGIVAGSIIGGRGASPPPQTAATTPVAAVVSPAPIAVASPSPTPTADAAVRPTPIAKVSEQSGRSEHAEPVERTVVAPPPGATRGPRKPRVADVGSSAAAPKGRRAPALAAPTIKLDPNPY